MPAFSRVTRVRHWCPLYKFCKPPPVRTDGFGVAEDAGAEAAAVSSFGMVLTVDLQLPAVLPLLEAVRRILWCCIVS